MAGINNPVNHDSPAATCDPPSPPKAPPTETQVLTQYIAGMLSLIRRAAPRVVHLTTNGAERYCSECGGPASYYNFGQPDHRPGCQAKALQDELFAIICSIEGR